MADKNECQYPSFTDHESSLEQALDNFDAKKLVESLNKVQRGLLLTELLAEKESALPNKNLL